MKNKLQDIFNVFLTRPFTSALPLTLGNTAVYYPGLDGLRGIAIILVLIEHWWKDKQLFSHIHFGALGVGLFFVLSGFLIGRILLIERINLESGRRVNMGVILKNFYIRRALRIFPIYYIFLFALLIIGFPAFIKVFFPWAFFYMANIKLFIDQSSYWPLGHLWTLSIEEQFYFIIPLLILRIRYRYLFYLILGSIFLGVASKCILFLMQEEFFYVFTFSVFDYFGMGMLLSFLVLSEIKLKYAGWFLLLAGLLWVYLSFPVAFFNGKSFLFVVLPVLPFIGLLMVQKAIDSGHSFNLFQLGPLKFIGKISYGIYLYHQVIPYLRDAFIPIQIPLIRISVDCLLTVLLAYLSYICIERPLNNLKKKFN